MPEIRRKGKYFRISTNFTNFYKKWE